MSEGNYRLVVGPCVMGAKLIDPYGNEVKRISAIEIGKLVPHGVVSIRVELQGVEMDVTALGEDVAMSVPGRQPSIGELVSQIARATGTDLRDALEAQARLMSPEQLENLYAGFEMTRTPSDTVGDVASRAG